MTNLTYAGIGTRQPEPHHADSIDLIARYLARWGYVVHSGAADGTDQLFSTSALMYGGSTVLHLPWQNHADEYLSDLDENQLKRVDVRVLQSKKNRRDQEAFASVERYHPRPDKLTWGARLLHARNYRIIVPEQAVSFVIALPAVVSGKATGGTMQGIRLAEQLGVPVVRLDQLSHDQAMDQIKSLSSGLWR